MQEKLVNILFKAEGSETLKLQPGTMTLEELYSSAPLAWVVSAEGQGGYTTRRNFHIVSGEVVKDKAKVIVCDIDGCLNFIDGANLTLWNGNTIQWTEIDSTAYAKPVKSLFETLTHFASLGYKIIFLTARGESQRVSTERFIDEYLRGSRNEILKYTLFMRGMTVNDIPAPEIKTIAMQCAILPYYDVEWFIEDCPKNVAAMRLACPEVPVMHILR